MEKPALTVSNGKIDLFDFIKYLESRRDIERSRNDNFDNTPDQTAAIRGRIAFIKDILAQVKPQQLID